MSDNKTFKSMKKNNTNKEKVMQNSHNEMLTINFKLSKVLFDTFYQEYNQSKSLRSKLKLQQIGRAHV